MKVKENVTLYKCDFCSKKLFVKHAMENHEKWCGNNPENVRACSGCKFLEETTVDYEQNYNSFGEGYGVIFDAGTETKTSKAFRCAKLDKLVYPLKVEKKGLVEKYPETFENQIPMPKECEFRSDDYFN